MCEQARERDAAVAAVAEELPRALDHSALALIAKRIARCWTPAVTSMQ